MDYPQSKRTQPSETVEMAVAGFADMLACLQVVSPKQTIHNRRRRSICMVKKPNNSYSEQDVVEFEPPSKVESITSTANPYIKHLVKLRDSSPYRHAYKSLLLVGSTSLREVSEYLQQKSVEPVFDCIFVKDREHVPSSLFQCSKRVMHVSHHVIKKMAGIGTADSTHVIGVMKLPKSFLDLESMDASSSFQYLPDPRRLLALDGIQDPGNLGTLIRTAAAFQWDGVFLLPGCCDPFNDKAMRASRGACFQIPILRGLWSHLHTLKDQYKLYLYAAHPESSTAQDVSIKSGVHPAHENRDCVVDKMFQTHSLDKDGPCKNDEFAKLTHNFAHEVADKALCLVLGSEGVGLSEESKRSCRLISIPMPSGYESLNVSVAGGIFLFLLRKNAYC